jgi:hypothetical protein
MQPVLMSMVVAALLLNCTEPTMKVKTLVAQTQVVYRFIRHRRLYTVMSLEPNACNVGYEVAGFGLKTQPGADDSEVLLAPCRDKVTAMSLAYYAQGLLRHFEVEVLACHLLLSKKAHTLDTVSEAVLQHLAPKQGSLTKEDVVHRLGLLEKTGQIEIRGDLIALPDDLKQAFLVEMLDAVH